MGIQCFTKKALQFVSITSRGYFEDIDEFRFLEHGHKIKFIMTEANTLSVDTPKDLERVRMIIREKLDKGEIRI